MLSEILPLGVVTNIYSNIKNKKIKKRVSQSFHLQIAPFESWMTIVTLTRNLCCHHARVWNKQNTLRPMIPNIIVKPWINLPTDTLRIYFDMCIIKYFLNIISPGNDMRDKMEALYSEYPEVDLGALGFPSGNWQEEPLWSTRWRRQGLSKKEKMGWLVPTSSTLIEYFFLQRKRRKDLPHHQPIPFASLDFIPLIYTDNKVKLSTKDYTSRWGTFKVHHHPQSTWLYTTYIYTTDVFRDL